MCEGALRYRETGQNRHIVQDGHYVPQYGHCIGGILCTTTTKILYKTRRDMCELSYEVTVCTTVVWIQ